MSVCGSADVGEGGSLSDCTPHSLSTQWWCLPTSLAVCFVSSSPVLFPGEQSWRACVAIPSPMFSCSQWSGHTTPPLPPPPPPTPPSHLVIPVQVTQQQRFPLTPLFHLIYKLFTFHPTNCSPFTLQTVHLSSYKLFTFHPTNCSPFTLQTVHLSPYKLFTFHPTNCSPFTLQTVHLSLQTVHLSPRLCPSTP